MKNDKFVEEAGTFTEQRWNELVLHGRIVMPLKPVTMEEFSKLYPPKDVKNKAIDNIMLVNSRIR